MGLSKYKIAGLISLIALTACNSQNNPKQFLINSEVAEKSAIIAGFPVSPEESLGKSIVAIFSTREENDTRGSVCTGSLLQGNVVLTAAHCVNAHMTIIFSNDINVAKGNLLMKVDRIAIPSIWKKRRNEDRDHGDIALLHFVGEVPQGYVPATLLTDATRLKNGSLVYLAGYGVNNVAETPIDIDKYPDLINSVQTGKVVCDDPDSLKNCAEVDMTGSGTLRKTQVYISDVDFSKTEVLLDQTKGTGACHGDSGGPAYLNIDGKLYLWGITSRGEQDPKNNCSQYAVYTSTLYYQKWINKVLSQIVEN